MCSSGIVRKFAKWGRSVFNIPMINRVAIKWLGLQKASNPEEASSVDPITEARLEPNCGF